VLLRISAIKRCFIFSPRLHLTSAFALPGETGNPGITSFHLNAACCFTKNARNTLTISTMITGEPPFTVKTIDCNHQTGGRDHSILQYVTLTLDVTRSVTVSVAMSKME